MVIETAAALDRRYCSQCKKWRAVAVAADTWAYCERCGTILVRAEMRRRYAGFWRRAGGYFIDYFIFLPLEVPFYVEESGGAAALFLVAVVLTLANLIAGNARGATLGKAVFRMRVVNAEGGAPGYRKSVGRYLMSIFSGVLLIGYLAMIWDRQKQTWHDHAAGTFVVKR
jgi:uncharacterized RDD family membrane protein YckC